VPAVSLDPFLPPAPLPSYVAAFEARCAGLNAGTVPALRSFNSSQASLVSLLAAAESLLVGLSNHLATAVAREAPVDPLAQQLLSLWGQ
jgi:hypothetical protein